MKTKNKLKQQITFALFSFFMINFNVFAATPTIKKNTIDILTIPSIFAVPSTIPSCSTQPVTFIAYSDLYADLSLSYIWNVGPGWNISGTTYTFNNTLILTPSSTNSNLGSVSCKIVYTNNNGNQSFFDTNSATVTRNAYSSNASISGSTNTCSASNTYNLSGLLTGENVTWSLSDYSIASLSNSSNAQTTVTSTNSGSVDLIATITNSCNQTTSKIFKLYFGVPILNNFSCNRGRDFCSGNVEIESNTLPILDINDKITANFSGLTTAEAGVIANWQWQVLNPNISLSGNLNQRRVGILNYGDTGIKVRVKNSCGWSEWYELNFTVTEIPAIFNRMRNESSTQFSVFPNPVNDYLSIDFKDKKNSFKNKTIINAEISDMYNNTTKLDVNFINNKGTVDVRNLKKGIYILRISTNEKTEIHKIIVQ